MINKIVVFMLVFMLSATSYAQTKPICFSRQEIAAMRLKNAERKTKIKQLENQLEGCRKSKAKALEAEITKRKRLEDDIRRMNPVLPWVIVGIVGAVAVGAILVGVLR